MSTNTTIARDCLGLTTQSAGRFLLRRLVASDYDALFELLSTSEDMSWERVPATPAYTRELLDFRLHHYEEHGFGIMAVMDECGRMVGQAGLQALTDLYDEEVELVVFLRPTAIGHGIGRLLSEFFIRVSGDCGMSRLFATIRPGNSSAEFLVQKLGFQPCGLVTHFRHTCSLWRLSLPSSATPKEQQ